MDSKTYSNYKQEACEFTVPIKLNIPVEINPILMVNAVTPVKQELPVYLNPELYLAPEVSAQPPKCESLVKHIDGYYQKESMLKA